MFKQTVIAILIATANPCFAQQTTEPNRWTPQGTASELVDFTSLRVARISDDGKYVRFICQRFKPEKRVKTVTVCRTITELRRRTEKNADGSVKEVDYSVAVPVFTEGEIPFMAMIPDGSYRLSVPIEEVAAWDLAGNSLAVSAVSQKLKIATHVLVEEKVDPSKKPSAIEPYYASILKSDTIRIHLPAGASGRYLEPDSEGTTKSSDASGSGKR